MQVCDLCQRQYPRRIDFTYFHTAAGRQLVICRRCRPEAEAEDKSRASPVAGHPSSGLRLAAQSDAEPRQHPRRDLSLDLTFQIPRDPIVHGGRLRDISQGGLRFATDQALHHGQLLNVTIRSGESQDIRAVVQVVRVMKKSGEQAANLYEVGGRFVGRDTALRIRNRRTHPRIQADFAVHYRRQGRADERNGRVRDISRGGLRFYAPELLDPGEVFQVRLEAGQAAAVAGFVAGTMVVVACRPLKRSSLKGSGFRVSGFESENPKPETRNPKPERSGLDFEIRARFVTPGKD